MKYPGSVENMEQQDIAFVRSLNTEKVSAEQAIERVKGKGEGMNDSRFDFFISVVYDWLWAEPQKLVERRESGELDMLFKPGFLREDLNA